MGIAGVELFLVLASGLEHHLDVPVLPAFEQIQRLAVLIRVLVDVLADILLVVISRKTVYAGRGKSIELNPGQSEVYTKRAENGVRSGLIRDDGRRSMQCACVCVRPGASAHE